jgi:DNA-binding MarR family transcriptional regulator
MSTSTPPRAPQNPNHPLFDLTGTGSCASFNFRRTARAVTRLFDLAFHDCGLRSTQFTILVGIAKTQPTSISALADLLIIDPTTLTRSLRRLQKEGLLAISDRSKMRQRFLTLTPQGQQILARSLPAWRETQERFVQTIGADYWINFRRELERLAHLTVDLENAEQSPGTDPAGPAESSRRS